MIVAILEDHLDEADYLFSQRLAAAEMADMTDEDTAELETRLRAHLNGLALGGDAAWDLCENLLPGESRSECFVAAIVAMECGVESGLAQIEQVLAGDEPEAIDGVRWALCLTVWPDIEGFLRRLFDSEKAPLKAAALEAMTYRGIDAGDGVKAALEQDSGPLLAAGIRAAGRWRLTGFLDKIEPHTHGDDPDVCSAALASLVRIAPEKGRSRCLEVVRKEESCAPAAIALLGEMAIQEDLNALIQAGRSSIPTVARSAVLALGEFGDVLAVPVLIELLDHKGLAGVAGVALIRILGDELPDEHADSVGAAAKCPANGDEPPGRKAGEQTSEEADDDLDWSPDDDLPRLSASSVTSWWADNLRRYPTGVRYRFGQPVQA